MLTTFVIWSVAARSALILASTACIVLNAKENCPDAQPCARVGTGTVGKTSMF